MMISACESCRIFLFVAFFALCRQSHVAAANAADIVDVSASSSTSLKVVWSNASISNSISVSNYQLFYGAYNCSLKNTSSELVEFTRLTIYANETQSLNDSRLSYVIQSLSKWACYQVKISVVLESGEYHGDNSTITYSRTSEDAPTGAPRNFVARNSSSTSLELTWQPPLKSQTHGFIRNYAIRYKVVDCKTGLANDSNADWTLVSVGADERSFNLTNLSFWTCYDVSISAVTVKEGLFTNQTNQRTSEHAPTGAPTNFVVKNSSSTSLELSWHPPSESETHGFIRNYTIRYKVVDCKTGIANDSNADWTLVSVGADERSFNLTNLSYWTCYDVSISAVTVEEGLFTNHTKTRTSEHAPTGAPTNFVVRSSSSTSLELTWQPPSESKTHGFIRNYTIRFKVVDCKTGIANDSNADWTLVSVGADERSFNLTNLSYWTCYDVSISAVTVKEGLFTNQTNQRTSEHAPTGAPTNFVVRNSSSTSLELTWQPPSESKTHGFIRNYTIRFKVVDCKTGIANDSNADWTLVSVGADERSFNLTNLSYWTCYDVSISAVTVKEGLFTNQTNQRTSEHAPTGAPTNFVVRNSSSTSLELKWQPPSESKTHGFIRNYTIRYKVVDCKTGLANDSNADWTLVSVGADERSFNLTNLSYWTCYDVSISAVTVKEGLFTNQTNQRTSEHAPTGAPTNFVVRNSSSTSLELTWQPPLKSQTHGFIRNYTIRYKVVDCKTGIANDSNADWTLVSVGADERSFNLTNLSYWTCYDVSISAVTVEEGLFTNHTKTRTSEHAPTGAPTNFVVRISSSTSLELTWQPPSESKTHGFIRNYTIRFKVVDCKTGIANDSNADWTLVSVGADERSFNLTNLSYWTCYDVSISAVTVKEGLFTNQTNQRTSEHAPTGAPTNFVVRNSSSTSLELSWQPPSESKTHGFIRNYVIRYKEVDCNSGEEKHSKAGWNFTTVGPNSRSVNLTKLWFWSCYDVSISAVTVGEGPFANQTKKRTSEDAPTGAPTNFAVRNSSSTSLELSWQPPSESKTHGFIRNYVIRYKEVDCNSGEEKHSKAGWNFTTVGPNSRSVNLTKLWFWSCYDVSISAVTVGEGPFANQKKKRTSEDAPTGAPTNFAVRNSSSTSLELSWQPPSESKTHGFIRNYVIRYKEVDCNSGEEKHSKAGWNFTTVGPNSRSVNLTKLWFWSCYDVSISAVTVGEGPFANQTKKRTSEDAPTGAPTNFAVRNSSSTSLELSWQPPSESKTHGFIRNYVIRYKEVDCNSGEEKHSKAGWNFTTVGPNSRSVNLTKLWFWSCYDVSISAVTVGEGPFANQKKKRTSEDAPTGAPTNFAVRNSSSTSLELSWQPPSESKTHGFIRNYVIRYKEVDCNSGEEKHSKAGWNFTTVGPNSRSVNLTKLWFWSCYDVSISAVTVGEGPFANQTKKRTSEDAPTGAPTNFAVRNSSSTSLELSWQPPSESKTHGFIRNYVIRYKEVDCNSGEEKHSKAGGNFTTVGPNSRSVNLTKLWFWSCYDVSISAVTVGEGPFANQTKKRTSEDAPTGAPTNFAVRNSSSTSLELSWQPPSESKTHGFIRNYVIRYKEVDCNSGEEKHSKAGWNFTTVGPNSRSVNLTKLWFWSCYDVSISAVTVGEGPFANQTKKRTSEDAPTGAPTNFAVRNSSSTSLELSWQPPSESKTHGFIRNYVIRYKEVDCNSGEEKHSKAGWNFTTVGPNSRSVNLTKLWFWSCYDVSISAVTVGEGPFANQTKKRTSEDAPTGAPTNFAVRNSSSTSLELSWQPPSESKTHGFIRNYVIRYKEVDCNSGEEKHSKAGWNFTTVGPNSRSVNLTKLWFWSCYDVSISAVTVGEGPFANQTKERTSEDAPTGAPTNFAVRNSSSTSLELSWQPPSESKTHGFIRNYVIRYKEVDCNSGEEKHSKAGWNFTTVGPNSRSVNLTKLWFWSCYDVSISAVTVGEGPFANQTKKRTSEDAPTGVPTNFAVRNSSSTSLELNWQPPFKSKTHGFIRNYVIRYKEVDCNSGEEKHSKAGWNLTTVGSNSRSVNLTKLWFWSCYDVSISAVTVGEGPFANQKKKRTSEDVPTGAPTNFVVRNSSSTSLELNWQPPLKSKTHGFIRHYVIRYKEVDCNSGEEKHSKAGWNLTTVGSNSRSVILTKLWFWSCYDVSISAVTVGEGPFANQTKMRTSEDVPTGAPTNFVVRNSSSTSLELNWQPPLKSKTHGFIRHYVIRYKEVDCNSGEEKHSKAGWNLTTVGSNSRSVILTKLWFWSCYDVSISAVTVGEGPFANQTKMRTSEDVPTGVPTNFAVRNSSSTSLELNWQPPLKSKTHGFIRHYVIRYKEVDCNSGEEKHSKAGWNLTTVGSNSRSVNLTKLWFWSCYDVRISAVTVGEGPFANQTKKRTSENAPTKPPVLNFLSNTSSTSLLAKWDLSPLASQHGIIRGCRVFYQESSCQGSVSSTTVKPATGSSTGRTFSTPTEKTEPAKKDQLRRFARSVSLQNGIKNITVYNNTQAYIRGLKKWTCYSVYVSCWTVAEGPTSRSRLARTTEDRPGAPSFVSCAFTSSTQIKVVWNEPWNPYGILLNYRLSWMYNGSIFVSDSRNGNKEFSSSIKEDVIENLQIFSNYTFVLQARTSVGWGERTSTFCRTNHSSPTMPRDLVASVKSAWEIEIFWKRPEHFNGLFLHYKITYTNAGTGEAKTHDNIKSTKESFTQLEPYTKYEFAVACVGSGGVSEDASVSATTEASSPKPPTGIPPTVTEPVSDVTFTVRLQTFSSINGPIKYYWIIVYDTAGGVPKDPSQYLNSDFKSYENFNVGELYIAANLKTIPKNGLFTVGDGKTYSNISSTRKRRSSSQDGFKNGRLNPESTYKVFQRAFVSDTLYSSSSWYGPFKTGATPTKKPPDVAGPVAGGVVAGLVIFGIIAGMYFYRKRRMGETKPDPPGIPMGGLGTANTGYVTDDGPIPVEHFEAYCQRLMRNGGIEMEEQYKSFRDIPAPPAEHSKHEINRDKNRYNNILAYDHCRVQLKRYDNSPEADYINANYIDGYGKRAAYIASQGALDWTREDFWRMVWEQDVPIIVMVTRVEENGKIKCSQYWPLSGSMTYGTMQISVSESTQLPDFNTSVLSILNSREPGVERFVRHFHFVSWPDHGVPSASALISFVRRVNENTPPDSGPVLVHCSAGVGRTGTYIVMDANMKRIVAEKNVDILNYLQTIRKQRNLLVQTESQFNFIHEALLEYIKCGYTEILAKDLRDHVKSLSIRVSDEESKLDREFQKLNEFAQSHEKTFKAAHLVSNKGKNRFFNLLPYDDTRVALRILPGVAGSDYINASFIDGYHFAKAFIATQAPLPNTVDDFWRMVYEQQCSTLVCLIKDSESARTKMHEYWPEKEERKSGPLLIEKLKEDKQMDFIIRDFKLTNSQRGSSRVVRHFQFTAWPDNGMPENSNGLVDFIGQVQKWQQQSGNSKVVVHCSTGVGRTGVFIALVNLIDRLKSEGVVNVFQTVRGLRCQRPAMVQTKGQYMFCYLALQHYLASFDIYSNFM